MKEQLSTVVCIMLITALRSSYCVTSCTVKLDSVDYYLIAVSGGGRFVLATRTVVIGAKGGPSTTTHALTIQMGKDFWMHSRLGSLCHSHDSICLVECVL